MVTVEKAQDKFDMAHDNFVRAQLQGVIGQLLADAGDVLRDAADGAYDFIFLDSARQQYAQWWPQLDRALAAGGVLVVDNASSHYADMAGFIEAIARRQPLHDVPGHGRQGRIHRRQGGQLIIRQR